MTSVGSYEAKTHLPALLARVAKKGEKIIITKRGQPVAMLVPPEKKTANDIRGTLKQLRELRRGNTLGPDLSIRDLIESGRRL